jgi:DNA polymerase III subunit epsilon
VPEAEGLPDSLVFVDLETTGGNAAQHRIIEIGVVRMQGGATHEEWSTLVNPECRIPAYIESFTGITNEMVSGAPRFGEVAALVLEKLTGSPHGRVAPVFVAHNARFDYGFLRAEFRRLSKSFSAPVLCTVKLSRRLYPEHVRHSLDAVMERHGLACGARHRALGDASVLRDFWAKLLAELPRERLTGTVEALLAAPKLPAQLPPGLAEELPEGPGVYRFFGEDDVLLYVGKGGSLRTAMLGHLAEDTGAGRAPGGGRDRRLREAVRRVVWEETAGELGAQLRELAHARAQPPLYGRPARDQAASEAVTLRVAEDSGAVLMQPLAELPAEDFDACFGVFNALKDARKALVDIAAARRLCPKVLGIEEGPGSCMGHQLGRCKGACVGKEPLILHAVRVQMALSSLKLKVWPFPGRVAIAERRAFHETDWHVLDRWRYLGTARSEEDLAALATCRLPERFDVQVYRIMTRHLANHPKLDWRDLEAHSQARDDGAYRAADVSS